MQHLCLTIYRLTLTVWLGAAVFFAAVAIKPLRHRDIEAIVRPKLALIMFPDYYLWGFTLLGIAIVTGVLSRTHPQWSPKRAWASLISCALAAMCMLIDRLTIYAPLEAMMKATLASQVAAAEFRNYHVASWTINGVMTTFCLISATLACWPGKSQLAAQVDPSV